MAKLSANLTTPPDWVRWLAQDANGDWWGYEAEPQQHHCGWYENEVGRSLKLGAGEVSLDWRTSLIKVSGGLDAGIIPARERR